MIIGVRKEIKAGETRVALTPRGVQTLLKNFQNIYFVIDHNAGLLSGYSDDDYLVTGNGRAVIEEGPEIYQSANIVIGVKELQPSEYQNLESAKQGTIIACFWHVMDPTVREIVNKKKLHPIWFEKMPGVLDSMSEITGNIAYDVACQYLRKNYIDGKFIGRGLLAKHATITILGAGGTLGRAAYELAKRRILQNGATGKIIIVEKDSKKIHRFALEPCVRRLSTPEHIFASLLESDAVISGVHIPGQPAPKLITEEMLKQWGSAKPYAVLVDPAIDQGGISETSRPTTHQQPLNLDGLRQYNILHYAVPNMPASIPAISTPALENALLPNLIELIGKTYKEKSGN